ncbi:hypothetical protein UY3_06927 [Chelonia mydas]|uniref:Uncharacterized protein n=1 Tax=Chelonia mydas TaxID=8469 RepID=M7BFD3_CHEMY|nr:hypothetical protein UY3_06927 [Chelonia mydas]
MYNSGTFVNIKENDTKIGIGMPERITAQVAKILQMSKQKPAKAKPDKGQLICGKFQKQPCSQVRGVKVWPFPQDVAILSERGTDNPVHFNGAVTVELNDVNIINESLLFIIAETPRQHIFLPLCDVVEDIEKRCSGIGLANCCSHWLRFATPGQWGLREVVQAEGCAGRPSRSPHWPGGVIRGQGEPSSSPHWPRAVNRGHWEPRSAKPADTTACCSPPSPERLLPATKQLMGGPTEQLWLVAAEHPLSFFHECLSPIAPMELVPMALAAGVKGGAHLKQAAKSGEGHGKSIFKYSEYLIIQYDSHLSHTGPFYPACASLIRYYRIYTVA